MVDRGKFYIFEHIKNKQNREYDRVWIVEQVQNRFIMRVTYLAQITVDYQNARNGAEKLMKSLSSMRAYLWQQDGRAPALDIVMDQAVNQSEQPKARIAPGDLIGDALDLIEEDLNMSIAAPGQGGEESSEEEDRQRNSSPEEVKVVAPPKVYQEDYSIPDFIWDFEEVPDWSERIASYTDEQRQLYHDLVPRIAEFKGLIDSTNGWELIVDDKSGKIKIETKKSLRGNMMIRAQGPIDAPPVDVARLVNYRPLQKDFDLNQDWTTTHEHPGTNFYVIQKKTKSKMVVSARDFVVNILYNKESDGTIYSVASSTNVKFKVDPIKGVVRAD